jgi:hypothetical protein
MFNAISGHGRVKANIACSSITCQSGSPPGLTTINSLSGTEEPSPVRLFNNLLRSACAESPDVMYQIPDVVVRFDFSKRGHSGEPDAIFHNPEQFTIGISLHIARCQVRRARVHPSTIVSRGVAIGAMAHYTIRGVEFVAFLNACLQITGRRGDTLAATPTDQKAFCLGRKNGFQVARLLNRVDPYLSKADDPRPRSQREGDENDEQPALHPIREALQKASERGLSAPAPTGYDAALIAVTWIVLVALSKVPVTSTCCPANATGFF